MMRRSGPMPFALPAFSGLTRVLILLHLAAFFLLALAGLALHNSGELLMRFALVPALCPHGAWWQLLTYSFVHPSITGTLTEMLSIWFLMGYLESMHRPGWLLGLYITSILGTAFTIVMIYGLADAGTGMQASFPIAGGFGGLFGLLVAMGLLHGEVQFLLFFTLNVSARAMAIIYGLIAFAMLITSQHIYALGQLGGALFAFLYIWMAPEAGLGPWMSERWYSIANGYYRWKRRRAGRKFEVYMHKQGKTVHLDGYGRPINDDKDPRDPKHWN
jgi:membrane associated rhomboid family serine protease